MTWNQLRRDVISYHQKCRVNRQSKTFAAVLLLTYVLFTLSPFLLLHSHSAEDHHGSHVETTHAHAWDIWSTADEHEDETGHNEGSEAPGDDASHFDEDAEGHEGMDGPHLALVSFHTSMVHFQPPTLYFLDRVPQLPKSALTSIPDQVPIPSGSYPDDVSFFLTCDLPPPAIA
ncbi:MAG: hypothetical protein ABIW76_06015 [Fibrobacteria bacterium]